MLVIFGLLLFFLMRRMMQRQAQKMHDRMQQEITPDTARQAVLALNDDQHKSVYQAIASEDAKRAMMVFKQSTGASVQDSLVAVQALYRHPQPAPSEIQFQEGFDLNSSEGDPDVRDEYLEDAIDEVRGDADSQGDPGQAQEGPLAEADPNTGRIIGENDHQVPDVPANQDTGASAEDEDDVDAKARELMDASGFDPDAELTIPEDWSAEDEQTGFHLEVQRGEEKISLSHEDLEPWVHDQLYALLRDDHVDQAAELLAANSPLTAEEAHRFLVVFKNQS